jgi:hypothetical protein
MHTSLCTITDKAPHIAGMAATLTIAGCQTTQRGPQWDAAEVMQATCYNLLWLPSLKQEEFDLWTDRVRSSVRPQFTAVLEAAGRYGVQRDWAQVYTARLPSRNT